MKKKFLASAIAIFALLFSLLGTAQPAFTADIPDEQLSTPFPPVASTGGYSGAYFDDQRTLFRAFTYVEAWDSRDFSTAKYTTCTSSTAAPCNSNDNVFYETPLSPCSTEVIQDCVTDFAIKMGEKDFQSGSLVELLTSDYSGNMGTESQKRYNSPFVGDKDRGIPNSGKASIWKFAGVTHPGGDEFLLIPKLNGQFIDVAGKQPSSLDVGVYAVSRSTDKAGCFFKSTTSCFKRWPLPLESRIKVSLKTYAHVLGWFHGRIGEPVIESSKSSNKETFISVEGTPMKVPTVAVWAKNSDLPPALDKYIEDEFVARGNQFAGVAFYGGDKKSRAEQAVIDERNPSFDAKYFDFYSMWVKVAQDKAYAMPTTWSFRSMQETGQYTSCIGDNGVAGMVTTNSNAYVAGPPQFTGSDLAYQVGSPHFDTKGEVIVGTYDLAIRSDVARCIYKFSNAPIQASVSIIYATGEAKTATTTITEKNNWLRLSAKGFTYSTPTVKVTLSQEKAKAEDSPTPTPTPSKVALTKSTITCVKGKNTKKVTSINPKCPAGYKKKA